MRRSALSLIGSLVGLLYLAYLCFELVYAQNPRLFTLEALGFSVRVAVLLPSALLAGAAVMLGWIGFTTRKRGPVLAAALLYLASLPLVLEIFAVPLALFMILLADFFASLIRHRKERAAIATVAPEAEGASPGWRGEADDLEDDSALDADDALDDSGDGSDDGFLNDGLDDESLFDTGDDLRLEALLDDMTGDTDDDNRPRSDGMALFLGVFMGFAALALLGMVVYGVMGGKLPFMP